MAQAASLDWLAQAHAESEATTKGLDATERDRFAARIRSLLNRCGCGPDRIRERGHSVTSVAENDFGEHSLYNLRISPRGATTAARSELFTRVVDDYVATTYALDLTSGDAPDDLIHVTCTGYVSPSAPQRLVASRGWATRVTHAYHMGCYAALPALRIAAGFAATGSRRVDLVHTELCSLHLDPSNHSLEQLVVQSLFGDGLIRYSLAPSGHGLRVLTVHEQLLPDSASSMSWTVSETGMRMTLARDVPERIASALRGFVTDLLARSGRTVRELAGSVLAVHPGGPKILDSVERVLELTPDQLAVSRRVLLDFGNMSSATLPHIWQRIVDDPRIPVGTLVPSLAFGPGLTICGALLEKC